MRDSQKGDLKDILTPSASSYKAKSPFIPPPSNYTLDKFPQSKLNAYSKPTKQRTSNLGETTPY